MRPRGVERQAEVTAEVHAPGLPRRQRVGARLERQVSHVERRRHDPAVGVFPFEHDGIGAGTQEVVRGRQPRDAAAHDGDPAAHASRASARWSRTTSARTSRYSASAFGIVVRTNRIPAPSATAFASMSRS